MKIHNFKYVITLFLTLTILALPFRTINASTGIQYRLYKDSNVYQIIHPESTNDNDTESEPKSNDDLKEQLYEELDDTDSNLEKFNSENDSDSTKKSDTQERDNN